jgi:hypothetical protein
VKCGGKITGNRVLPPEGQAPKVETSQQQSGKILGVEVTDMGTYWSVARPSGGLYGDGQGVTMTKDGEVAIWTGQGVEGSLDVALPLVFVEPYTTRQLLLNWLASTVLPLYSSTKLTRTEIRMRNSGNGNSILAQQEISKYCKEAVKGT